MTKDSAAGRPRRSASSERLFFMAISAFAVALAAAVAAVGQPDHFATAFGDYLLVESFIAFGAAWVDYLRRDGIRVFPKKSAERKAADSWKDRVPAFGEPPSPALPAPGPEGPHSGEYRKLIDAENALREKILNGDRPTRESEGDAGKTGGFAARAAVAGLALLCLAFCFEYLVPLIAR